MSIIFPFISPVNGITFYKENALKANVGDPLEIVRDRDNKYDINAFKILHKNNIVGFLPKPISYKLANLSYEKLEAFVSQVLSSEKGFGLRIKVIDSNLSALDISTDKYIERSVEKILVKNKQGRVLGEFVSVEGDKIRVRRNNMSDILYPAKLTNILK
jgi:hypothetical protein